MRDHEVAVLIGKRLSHLREHSGLSQAELGKNLYVSASAIGMWEIGHREIKSSMLREVAEYFSVSADYIVGLSDDYTATQKGCFDASKKWSSDEMELADAIIKVIRSQRK
jgi:transcriptional regulator with XRE-family HTH domain